jgi:hypothetical protein
VYEFAGPIGGTYPIWTDPSYWDDGLRARFNWRQQVRALHKNLWKYRVFLWTDESFLIAGALILLLTSALAGKQRWSALVRWDLLLLSLVPSLLYGLVMVQTRYLGAFVVLFWLALLPKIKLPANETSKAMVLSATVVMLLTPALSLARSSTRDLRVGRASRADWETAVALQALGLHTGDRVGCIGLSFDVGWARLARVTVAAQIPTGRDGGYWRASARTQTAVLRAFARTGAHAVVADRPPAGCVATGWRRLESSDRYVRILVAPTPSAYVAGMSGEKHHG